MWKHAGFTAADREGQDELQPSAAWDHSITGLMRDTSHSLGLGPGLCWKPGTRWTDAHRRGGEGQVLNSPERATCTLVHSA